MATHACLQDVLLHFPTDVPSILNFSAVLVEPANIVAASWEFVDGGRPIIGFNIDVTRDDVKVISEFEDVNTTQVSISVDHLEVEVYYILLVAGRNDLGTGEAQSYIFKTSTFLVGITLGIYSKCLCTWSKQ